MSTFLELFVELHEESGASGAAPTTTVGQAAEYLRLRNWVIRADYNIQTMWHDYNFLVDHTFSYNTVAGTQTKTPDVTWRRWDLDTFKLDNDPIVAQLWKDVKSEQFFTAVADRGTPYRVIVKPNGTLQFDPVPDAAYTITCDHWLKPVRLSADSTGESADNAKVSLIPEEFHQLIIARALKYYALYENSEDASAHADEIWNEMYPRFVDQERPNNDEEFSNGNHIEVIAQ